MCVAPPLIMPSTEGEHASDRGYLAPIRIPCGGQRVVVPEQLVCTVDQIDVQAQLQQNPIGPASSYSTTFAVLSAPFRLGGEVPLIQAVRRLPRHVALLEKGWLRLCTFG